MNSARFNAGRLEAAGFDELRVVHCRKVIRLLLTPKFLYLDCLGFPLLASFFCPLNEELLLWCPGLVFLRSYSIGFGEDAPSESLLTSVEEAVNDLERF
jgi:hypothetical protein